MNYNVRDLYDKYKKLKENIKVRLDEVNNRKGKNEEVHRLKEKFECLKNKISKAVPIFEKKYPISDDGKVKHFNRNENDRGVFNTQYEKFNDEYNKLSDEWKFVKAKYDLDVLIGSLSLKYFKNEIGKLKKIQFLLKPMGWNKFSYEKSSFQIWKYYRAYLLKEFVFYYYCRIAEERYSIDKLDKKIIHMIDHFFWSIPESNFEIDSKYQQRLISRDILEVKLSFFNDLKGPIQEKICSKLMIPIPNNRRKKPSNCLNKTQLNKILKQKLDKFFEYPIVFNTEEIAHIADKAGDSIQLDHMIPRKDLKNYVEQLSFELKGIREKKWSFFKSKKIQEEINLKLDCALPYLIGTLVTKDNNTKLRKKTDATKFNFNSIFYELKLLYFEISLLDANDEYKDFKWVEENLKINYKQEITRDMLTKE